MNNLRPWVRISKSLIDWTSPRRWKSCCHYCGVWRRVGEVQRPALIGYWDQRRNAGHSKWANIKHIKEAKDQERSVEITRFMNMLKIAIREGGGSTDPKVNSKVAQIIAQFKAAKLPMAAIDRALEREANRKAEKQQTLVYRGPGNCIIIVELSSDNLLRARQELNTILRKNKGVLGEESQLYLFEHKGIILSDELSGKPAKADNIDDVIVDAIEAGADDVTFRDDHPDFQQVYEFITAPDTFLRVKHALEKRNYRIASADLEYIPTKPIQLDDVTIQDALKLYQKLSEHPSVVKVATNIA